MKNRLKKIIITTGALLMFTMAPISQANPLGQYMSSMTTITAQAAELTQSARWVGEGNTWRVSDGTGGYLKNRWFQDDVTKDWYLLGAGDDNTIMFSGLVTDQATGKTYLLNPNHDGTFGKMLTVDGTYNINGKEVYLSFNKEHNGTYGAIISGLSDVRNTGITEKQLPSISDDSQTADEVVTPEKPAEAPKEDYGDLPGSNLDWGDAEEIEVNLDVDSGGYVEWR